MLSFAEFQEICRRSPQVLQSVVITQAVLLRRFAAVAWTAHRPKWAERHPEYCQESFSLTHAHERIVKRYAFALRAALVLLLRRAYETRVVAAGGRTTTWTWTKGTPRYRV